MDVAAWLCGLELGQYEQAFRKNDIDAEVLMDLTAEDLIGLGVASIGHRRKLLAAIAALRAGSIAATTPVTPAPAAVSGKASLAPGGERRQLTVMFIDLVDSTALAAWLDPEEMAEVLRTYQSAVAGAIARFEGHVAKYMGDGVLAYFGYPRAHEDEAERAVRAGLAAVAAVHSLGSAHGETLAARVGIATGPVVVGELIGEGAAREETVVGDTPNLAARLQTLAEPGTVVISARAQQLIGGLFELAELGVQILKGFPVPVRAWRVVGEGAAESRFEALHGADLTPLVGREHEIGLLLEHWERAKEGEGQVVLLAGEPGIGKSRLVRALRGRLENEPHTVLSHYCSPHHQTSSLHPVIGLLERAAGFAADDPATTRLDKLEALLALSTDDVPAVVPLLAALLSLETDARYLPLDMSPHRQKERTLEELVNQVLGLATRRPVLALYEDVHWVDPTSLELLDLLVDRVQGVRVLVLITFRPEFEPSWTPRYAHVTAMTVSRLSRRQGAAMVARLSGGKALPPAVLDQIVAKTDGVPLFVEELTRAVLETNLLRDEGDHYALAEPLPPMAIPTTLHESLLARLDRLAPARVVAQIAAAIGREFSHGLLAITAALPESELQAALDDLVGSGLVFRRGTPPDATYTFKHALVQDAAYSTLLRTRRQQLHARIAEVLEGRVAGNAETLPEIIAHHCTEAGLTERAARYWWQAAQLAIQRSATLESIAHLQNGLRLLQTLPENPEHVGLELDMQVAMGTACMAAKGWSSPVTVAAIARAEELCERLDDPIQRSIADFGRYVIYLLRGQVDAALATSRAMLGRAERKRDTVAMMIAHRCVGIVLVHRGEFDVGRTHMAEALTLYDPKEHADLAYRFSYEPQVANFSYLAHALLPLGYTDQAQQAFDQLMEEIRAQRHNPSKAFGLFQACLFCTFERDAGVYKRDGHIGVDESIVDELIAVCTEHGFFLWRTAGLIMKGWLMVRAGQADRGLAQLREGITAWRGDAKAMVTHWLLLLANALGSLGELRASLDTIEEALALLTETNERWKEAALYLCKGELLLALSARDRAEASFQRALDVARDQRARLWELRAAMALARLWVEKHERRKAQDILAPVYGWFTEGFEAPDLQDAKALLDELARTAPSSPGIC